jgi:hypothetical protein
MAIPLLRPRMSDYQYDATVPILPATPPSSSSSELEEGEHSPSLTEWEVGSTAADESLTRYDGMSIRLEGQER